MSTNPNIRDRRSWHSDGRYQALLESDSTALCLCDASGAITYFNALAVQLWGRKPQLGDLAERFSGAHMLYRADGKYIPRDQSPMADVLAGKVPGIYDAEVHIQRSDGSRIVVIVNIAPLVDDAGMIIGAVKSFRENPRRKRAE